MLNACLLYTSNDEGEEGRVSLETMIRGVCDPKRFLDIVENFTLFSEAKGETAKLVAKNHQFLGVNKAISAAQQIKKNQGKLGVFWHTQGSGKSLSLIHICDCAHCRMARAIFSGGCPDK